MDELKAKDYSKFIIILVQILNNLKELKTQTSSALNTIHTNFDFTEVASKSSGGIIGLVVSGYKENVNNDKIKNAVQNARNKLSVIDKWTDSDFAQKITNDINNFLQSQGMSINDINEMLTSLGCIDNNGQLFCPPQYYSYEELKDKTEVQELDIHKHGSYTSMTIKQIFLGDAAEDHTMPGTIITVGLQFVPVVDTILDVRDVVVDGYLWCTKSKDYSDGEKYELAAFTGLDVIGFIPIVGVLKYSDEAADLAKSGKNVGKTVDAVKNMDKVKGLEKMSDGAKDIEKGSDIAKDIDSAKDIEKGADAAKDAGKSADAMDDTAKSAKSQADNAIKDVESGKTELITTKQKGNYGEMKMDQHLEDELGYSRISKDRVTGLEDAGHKGIDGVYENASPPPKYVIAEAKYGTSQLNPLTNDGPQMSDRWIQNRLQEAVGPEEAKKIRREMIINPENVQKLLVKVADDGSVTTRVLK